MRACFGACLLLLLSPGCALDEDDDDYGDAWSEPPIRIQEQRPPPSSGMPRAPAIGLKVPPPYRPPTYSDIRAEAQWVPRIRNPIVSGADLFLSARDASIQPAGATLLVGYAWNPGMPATGTFSASGSAVFPLVYDVGQDLFAASHAASAIPVGGCRSLVVVNPNGKSSNPVNFCR